MRWTSIISPLKAKCRTLLYALLSNKCNYTNFYGWTWSSFSHAHARSCTHAGFILALVFQCSSPAGGAFQILCQFYTTPGKIIAPQGHPSWNESTWATPCLERSIAGLFVHSVQVPRSHSSHSHLHKTESRNLHTESKYRVGHKDLVSCVLSFNLHSKYAPLPPPYHLKPPNVDTEWRP